MYSIKGAGSVYVSRGLLLSIPIMYSIKGAGSVYVSRGLLLSIPIMELGVFMLAEGCCYPYQ